MTQRWLREIEEVNACERSFSRPDEVREKLCAVLRRVFAVLDKMEEDGDILHSDAERIRRAIEEG